MPTDCEWYFGFRPCDIQPDDPNWPAGERKNLRWRYRLPGGVVSAGGNHVIPDVLPNGNLSCVRTPETPNNHVMLAVISDRWPRGYHVPENKPIAVDLQLRPLHLDAWRDRTWNIAWQNWSPNIAGSKWANPPISLMANRGKWQLRVKGGSRLEQPITNETLTAPLIDDWQRLRIEFQLGEQGYVKLIHNGKDMGRVDGCNVITDARIRGQHMYYGAYCSTKVSPGSGYEYGFMRVHEMKRGRRIKSVRCSPEMMLYLVTPGERGRTLKAEDPKIPHGSRALRCGIDERGDLLLLIENEEFDMVEDGAKVPQLNPCFSEVRDADSD